MKRFWLVKSEPDAYSWDNLVADGLTSWTGVRNFTARNNLRAMSKGDEVLFYHSVTEKAVVGIATVKRTAYPDSTAKEGDWSTVDLVPKRKLARPVTLADIRGKSRPERHPTAAPVAIIGAATAQGRLRPHCANGRKLNRISP